MSTDIGNFIPDYNLPNLIVMLFPWLFLDTAEILHSSTAGNSQCACFRQTPGKPSKYSTISYFIYLRIIRWVIPFRVTGNIMASGFYHFLLQYCPPPMNPALMVSHTNISFSNHHSCIIHLKYNHSMDVIVHSKNISRLYILKFKLTWGIHSCFQLTKCRITEFKSKSYTTHSNNIRSTKSSALPTIIPL